MVIWSCIGMSSKISFHAPLTMYDIYLVVAVSFLQAIFANLRKWNLQSVVTYFVLAASFFVVVFGAID
jgi:hypothetical protein